MGFCNHFWLAVLISFCRSIIGLFLMRDMNLLIDEYKVLLIYLSVLYDSRAHTNIQTVVPLDLILIISAVHISIDRLTFLLEILKSNNCKDWTLREELD